MKNSRVKSMVLISLFAALTAVFSQISLPIPITPVPINLAMLSVFVVGGLLGAKNGAISQLIYVALGVVGLPVFANFGAGIGILLGPTGGYIIGYVLAALVIGLIKKNRMLPIWKLWIIMIIGLIVCYTFGTMWFMFIAKKTLLESLALCVVPFLFGDALKILAAGFLVKRLEKVSAINSLF